MGSIKKTKSIPIKTAKKKAWEAFSKYIRLRDSIKTTGTKTHANCYTCGKVYPAFGIGCLQAGHYAGGRKNAVLIDEVGVNAQCYNCNHTLKGNSIVYRQHLVKEYGEEVVFEIEERSFTTVPMKAYQWLEIAEIYTKKYSELLQLPD